MKKSLLTYICLVPILLGSCANNHCSFEALKEVVGQIENKNEHPFYRVQGVLDFNNSVTYVDANFNKNPTGNTFVPYARYNEGFYLASAGDSQAGDERNVVIYGMSSSSYWLRAPMKIDKDNFYVHDKEFNDETGEIIELSTINSTCAFGILETIILYWAHGDGNANPSNMKLYFEKLSNGGFAIGGDRVHTTIIIDNYPNYPDPEQSPEFYKNYGGKWSPYDPRPAYKNDADIKADIRFEYDKDGWLTREYVRTLDYDFNKSVPNQLYLESVYTYQFE